MNTISIKEFNGIIMKSRSIKKALIKIDRDL
jgi:hypothetical protein